MKDNDARTAGPRLLALCGGVGGAKLAFGLTKVLPPEDLLIAVNTGDDFEHLGLNICPDIDTVLYTLAGLNDHVRGWGRREESWRVFETLGAIGSETWFQLGDKDLALHLERTRRLAGGESLSQITQSLAARLGVVHAVAPMSDQPVHTIVDTEQGALSFQEYFVREKCAPRVMSISFAGADEASPSPAVGHALSSPSLEGVILCPSNPLLSLDPILSVPGVREGLRATSASVIAISPIIAGAAVKGPTVKILRELGFEPTALSSAEKYADFLDAYIIDEADADLLDRAGTIGPQLYTANTLMKNDADKTALARFTLNVIDNMRQASTRDPENKGAAQ